MKICIMMKTTVLVMITRVMKKMVEDQYDFDVLND